MATDTLPAPGPSRLRSLDVFRGLVIALMFTVNLAGDRIAFPDWMRHAGWNGGAHGQGLADYVFPWFLFIVGVAIPFSMGSGRGQGLSNTQRIWAAFKRGLILYLLGVLIEMARTSMDRIDWVGATGGPNGVNINGFVPVVGKAITWWSLRMWNILPLIGLGYFLGVCLNLLPRWAQAAFVLAVLTAKVVLMPSLAGQLGLERAAWIAARTDWEAETKRLGWLGELCTQGLPATCCVVLGSWAGALLLASRRRSASTISSASETQIFVGGRLTQAEPSGTKSRAQLPLLLGGGSLAIALAFTLDALGHRFSKDFFTSSYVLLSCGSAAIALWVCWLIVDRPAARTIPARLLEFIFVPLGTNALFIYVVGELFWTMVAMRWRFAGPDGSGQVLFTALQAHLKNLTTPEVGPWLATLIYITCVWLICRALHRRGVVIKV